MRVPRTALAAAMAALVYVLGAGAPAGAQVVPAIAKLPPPDFERMPGEPERRRQFRQSPHVKWAGGRRWLRVCHAGNAEAEVDCTWVRVRAH